MHSEPKKQKSQVQPHLHWLTFLVTWIAFWDLRENAFSSLVSAKTNGHIYTTRF